MWGGGEIAGLESGKGEEGLEDGCHVAAAGAKLVSCVYREKNEDTYELPRLAKPVSPGPNTGSRA